MTRTIVIDHGSYTIRSGFARETGPSSVIRSLIQSESDSSKLINPFYGGIVTDWSSLEKLWEHIFENELQVESHESRVMMNRGSNISKESKERVIQTLFERFNF